MLQIVSFNTMVLIGMKSSVQFSLHFIDWPCYCKYCPNYLDYYVGCDVNLGLGFCYNGDAEDEGAAGYGFNPPAIGVDFFQGPLADPNDGIDNDRDGIIDEANAQIIMSKFVYYNNDFTVIGNPSEGTHFYNYLRGIWKDNVPMTYAIGL